ncbi:DoxX family protein [Planctomicrobium sp. SH668]|uniref:DoxX family protein n=1 Tax=Planctomicrobium sp. SH668 TaxID=3448126 RepID=UPI003F5C5D60
MLNSLLQSFGLLVLRASLGIMMLAGHGLTKFMKFSELSESFPDPLGVGHRTSLILAIFSEVVCSALLVLGVATRFVVIPLITTMLIALVKVHGADPWSAKELAAVYLAGFVTILICGGGRLSLDGLVWSFMRPRQNRID